MERLFQINQQLDIPIYQQLVDRVRSAVKMGELVPGQKLPTVQELADRLGVAKGTVKRAYDELEHNGVLEKIQGRGTFVCYQPANSGSRKEQAMVAIDSLLDKLEEMGFSATEINIFLTLKQRERSEDLSTVKVAVVEQDPETLSQMAEQLRCIKGIELYCYLMDTIREYPYKLDEETDLVITASEHAEFLESILPDRKKLVRMALRLSMATLSAVIKLKTGERTGILAASGGFGDTVYAACKACARNVAFLRPGLLSGETDVEDYLREAETVLVPKGYEKYCTAQTADALQRFEKRGKLILCAYEMDEGSQLHLEERLVQLRQDKKV